MALAVHERLVNSKCRDESRHGSDEPLGHAIQLEVVGLKRPFICSTLVFRLYEK